MPEAVQLEGVSRVYESHGAEHVHALRDLTLTIPAGTSTAIVGRSGSGKSTLLHLCAGIEVPTAGDVKLFGTSLQSLSETQRTRLRRDTVGLVFQFFHLLPHLSVHDNIALPLLIAGESVRTIAPRVEHLLTAVGLADRARELPTVLSGGEQQRVAICRALVHEPDLVLADEPTGNLDDRTGAEVMDLLLSMTTAEQRTLIYVTHSREIADRADHIRTLHSGTLEPA